MSGINHPFVSKAEEVADEMELGCISNGMSKGNTWTYPGVAGNF